MKNRARSAALVVLIALLAGCAPTAKPAPEIPPAQITAAAFRLGAPDTVVVTGEFFKMKSDYKGDVVVSIGGLWERATAVSASSPTSYTAVLPYGNAFPQVWVRVIGMDGEYSPPFLVQGQSK